MASKKNTRVFYASHDVSIKNTSNNPVEQPYTTYLGIVGDGVIQGAQSVSLDTNFGGEDQLFQLGRLEAYDSTLTAPEVEMSLTKSLDGWPLIWHHQAGSFTTATLLNQVNAKSRVRLTVGNDTDEYIGKSTIPAENKCDPTGTGTSLGATIEMTGCFLTGFNYTFGDGVFSEEITLLGNSKAVIDTNNAAPKFAPLANTKYWTTGGVGTGNVLSRQNFKQSSSTLPSLIQNEKISSITISADLGGEPLYQLGSFYAVDRDSPLPVNITVNFDVIADSHDCVAVSMQTVAVCASPSGLASKEPIYLVLCNSAGSDVYSFDFRAPAEGSGNATPTAKLNSVSYSGGDTGGGNVTITYSYIVSNMLNITYLNPLGVLS